MSRSLTEIIEKIKQGDPQTPLSNLIEGTVEGFVRIRELVSNIQIQIAALEYTNMKPKAEGDRQELLDKILQLQDENNALKQKLHTFYIELNRLLVGTAVREF